MAFALFSVFEPSIVKRIYELAKEPDTLDVKVIYFWDPCESFVSYTFTVPRDATIHDLKILIAEHDDFKKDYTADRMRLYVHTPWCIKYEEAEDSEGVFEYIDRGFEEFALDAGFLEERHSDSGEESERSVNLFEEIATIYK